MCKMCMIKTRIQKQSYVNLCIYEVAIKTNKKLVYKYIMFDCSKCFEFEK